MGEERRKAEDKEVKKLKDARLISEIKYPTWLANVMFVIKAYRKCIKLEKVLLRLDLDRFSSHVSS